jgi:plasmid stabilization system protein ParE
MTITWTARAMFDYDQIVSYLLEEWTIREAQHFIDEVSIILKQLERTPNMFENSEKIPYLRKGKIGKLTNLIYQLDDTEIVLLAFIDNRSNHSY